MKETDLAIFYHLGKSFLGMSLLEAGPKLGEPTTLVAAVRLLNGPELWLKDFLAQTKGMDMRDSRVAVIALLATIHSLFEDLADGLKDKNIGNAVVESATIWKLQAQLKAFEEAFTRDCKQLDVFTVTRKGLYSTRALIERPETKFPANLLAVMPPKTLQDLQEAGRCLAFERPTACAFHICRATEALMLAYYEKLANKPWPFTKRDWNIYNEQLAKEGAPKAITNRLVEIRADRNAYAHPDITVPLDEGPIVYELCTGVIFYMAKEIEKLP
ncbi:MAG: hypothetical protein ACR2G5_10515 [Pyrinomonadaceae bacterium]